MKQYEKPMIIATEDLAEGVYAASGASCYTFNARITQRPELGRDSYVVQIDGNHNAVDGHHSSVRSLIIRFNQPVTYIRSNAAGCVGDGSTALTLTFDNSNGSYHNNAVDYIGLGELYVRSGDGLAIVGVEPFYCNQECGQH